MFTFRNTAIFVTVCVGMEVNVQGVREVSNERTVWILKDRCDKGREESLVMVMRLMICGVYYYYYYTIK